MIAKQNRTVRKKRPLPEPEYTLVATVKSVTVSYYVQKHGRGVLDEASTDLICEIIAVAPNMPKLVGKDVTCILMCSRQYGRVDDSEEIQWPRLGKADNAPETPFLLSVRLDKNGGLISAYLPEAAYWPLKVDLTQGRLKFIEARFMKPHRGNGELISINFSETAQEESINCAKNL